LLLVGVVAAVKLLVVVEREGLEPELVLPLLPELHIRLLLAAAGLEALLAAAMLETQELLVAIQFFLP
jgi:hypothetical protein